MPPITLEMSSWESSVFSDPAVLAALPSSCCRGPEPSSWLWLHKWLKLLVALVISAILSTLVIILGP